MIPKASRKIINFKPSKYGAKGGNYLLFISFLVVADEPSDMDFHIEDTNLLGKNVVSVGRLLVGFVCSFICCVVMAMAVADVHVIHLVALANGGNRMMTTHL